MGFYLHKSSRLGPLRLNLSKSGIGASVGGTGARIGITPTGRAYVDAGRRGFSVRHSLGSRGAAAAATVREPVTLSAETDATDPTPSVPHADATPAPAADPAGPGLTCALLLSLAGTALARRARHARHTREALRRALAAAIADGRPLTTDELAAAHHALRRPHLRPAARDAVLQQSVLAAARQIAEDGRLTAEEVRLLEPRGAEFPLDPGLCRATRAAATIAALRGLPG